MKEGGQKEAFCVSACFRVFFCCRESIRVCLCFSSFIFHCGFVFWILTSSVHFVFSMSGLFSFSG